jgi:hypothetical protein
MQDGMEAFWGRVDDIGRARLDAEDKLHLKAADTLHRELLQELDRYCHFPFPSLVFNFLLLKPSFPLVERAVADVPPLADPEFAAGIRRHAHDLLQRSRGIPGALFFFLSALSSLLMRLGDDGDVLLTT